MDPLRFPFTVRNGRPLTVSGDALVRQAIELALFTEPGERVNLPDFGAGTARLLFEPGGDALAAASKHLVQAALQRASGGLYQLRDLTVAVDDAMLAVTVTYVDVAQAVTRTVRLERAK